MFKWLLKKLDYAWRLFAMTWFFIDFALNSLILGYVILPLMRCFSRNKNKQVYHTQYAIHVLLRFMIFLLQLLGVARFQFRGFEALKKDRGCLVLANHPTLIDYVAIMSQLPRCNNMVKKALCHNIFLKKVIATAAYIPNTQSFATLAAIKKTLAAGDNILMFPEGTRTVLNQPLLLKRGAAQIAIRAKAPIRLIHITCMPPILTKHQKWYKIPSKKPVFVLTVGERIAPEDFFKETTQPATAVRLLTHYLQNKLERG